MSAGLDGQRLAPATVGLALAVVRSKPPHTTIDEHLNLIIEHTAATGLSRKQTSSVTVDSTGYWKARYQQAAHEKGEIEDELLQLRTDLHNLRQSQQPVQKRRTDSRVTRANTQSKRRRLPDMSVTGPSDKEVAQAQPNLDPVTATLLRRLLILQQLNTSERPSPDDLENGISRLCQSVSHLLEREEELVVRVRPIYACILTALRHTYNASNNNAFVHIVTVFQAILSRFYQTALDGVVRKEHDAQQKSKEPNSNSRIIKGSRKEDEQRCYLRLAALTELMTLLFNSLNTSMEADNELYEALASALFDHIGSEVSLLIFADSHLDGTGLAPVTGLVDTAHIEPTSAIASAELSAPYLVKLLKSALSAIPRSRQVAEEDIPQHKLHKTAARSHQQPLLSRVEERLQHTLLRGIFGDDDPSFAHAFPRIEEKQAGPKEAGEEQEDQDQSNPAGFIGQVWELLGWDILSRGMAQK